ncbi:MAG: hypothetical protein HPY90_14590 [Syntrophothermus sp.]|uniref:hypothetical protein n=1 Tax=Syntrophothermus sp. TaxID=2736299 RepID=UPI00257B19EB|nr:hypothetical protein [Syntrophothermus sp.]NSW84460.1 hypothetical protein [Syntrophothermus sp.]
MLDTSQAVKALASWLPSETQKLELETYQSIVKVMAVLERHWHGQKEIDYNSFTLRDAETALYALYEYVCLDEMDDGEETANDQNPLHQYWLTEELRYRLHFAPPLAVEPDYI